MSIISGDIREVSSTKILVSVVYPTKLVEKIQDGVKKIYKVGEGKPLQLTVYSNKVDLGSESAAMILPFPLISGKNRVKIINMEKYDNIFEDIDLLFPMENPSIFGSGIGQDSEIQTENIGKYKVSLVPNLKSIEKFELKPDVKKLLSQYYPKGFGFIVCILNSKVKAEYIPLAYIHEICSDERLFIPTRHYHTHVNIQNDYRSGFSKEDKDQSEYEDLIYKTLTLNDEWMNLNAKKNNPANMRSKQTVDWNHNIYVINFPRIKLNPLLKHLGVKITTICPENKFYAAVESDRLPLEFIFSKPVYVHKITVNNSYKYNHDLFI